MCNFISWIEVEEGGEKAIFYLTDKEVFSKRGKETLKDCRGNDFIGHGAIREFFDLREKIGGVCREVQDFWNLDELPEELQLKIKDFDKYWGKMFRFFDIDDLYFIIQHSPDRWKEKASQQLIKLRPFHNFDLCFIIEYSTDKWKAKASQQLLKRRPSDGELQYIIDCSPDRWKAKAKKLLEL